MRALVLVLLTLVALGNTPAQAGLVVLDFEDALPGGLFNSPLHEDGFVFNVSSGHYDIGGFGSSGNAFNTDGFGGGDGGLLDFSLIRLSREDGGLFDVESLEVVTPGGESFSMWAIGNTGNIFTPNSSGLFVFGDDFHGVNALVTSQSFPGFFAFDNLTLNVPMPGPPTVPAILIGLACLAAVRHPRSLSKG